jgi:hypothetical protein
MDGSPWWRRGSRICTLKSPVGIWLPYFQKKIWLPGFFYPDNQTKPRRLNSILVPQAGWSGRSWIVCTRFVLDVGDAPPTPRQAIHNTFYTDRSLQASSKIGIASKRRCWGRPKQRGNADILDGFASSNGLLLSWWLLFLHMTRVWADAYRFGFKFYIIIDLTCLGAVRNFGHTNTI